MLNSAPYLLETIKIEDGTIHHIDYHQKRFDDSRLACFHTESSILLHQNIIPPSKGLYRCRIVYSKHIHSIEYIPYVAKEINTIQLIDSSITYPYKYADRSFFDNLLLDASHADDILIVKNGELTDTSIANIAFYHEDRWITPAKPLLYGTTRQRLIDEGLLTPKAIYVKNLAQFTHVALMNAMIGFKILNKATLLNHKGIQYDY